MTATGFNTNTGAAYNAYLDAGNAGLGVCQTLSGDQCAPSSDDNVTYQESLQLVFDQEVEITTTTFVNGEHKGVFNGNFSLIIDGVAAVSHVLTPTFSTPLIGTTFVFSNLNGAFDATGDVEKEFYINALEVNLAPPTTVVPIPAAAWLFGTGIMGLVGMAKRRKLNS
ncbi:MAG: VPLPA-CTERM sorting domain-containing protein [Methyloprofundus sp.]|nr:VPLPA-CTERM sorting domain-containing protein [Methyloprofundus sp.]